MKKVEIEDQIQKVRNDLHLFINSYKGKNPFITKDYKSFKTQIKELYKQLKDVEYQEDVNNGNVYQGEKWITKIYGQSYESLIDARKKLIEKLSKLSGVKIEDQNNSTTSVEVTTRYKIYFYSVHAHYRVEKIPESKRLEKDLCGVEREAYDYRNVYVAWLSPDKFDNGNNWAYR